MYLLISLELLCTIKWVGNKKCSPIAFVKITLGEWIHLDFSEPTDVRRTCSQVALQKSCHFEIQNRRWDYTVQLFCVKCLKHLKHGRYNTLQLWCIRNHQTFLVVIVPGLQPIFAPGKTPCSMLSYDAWFVPAEPFALVNCPKLALS